MVWSHHIIYMLNGDSGESRNETSDHERYFIDDPIRRKANSCCRYLIKLNIRV